MSLKPIKAKINAKSLLSLLFAAHAALLLLALFGAHLGSLFKLLNKLLFFNLTIKEMLSPLFVNLALSKLASFFFKLLLLLTSVFLNILVLQPNIFIIHQFTFLPLPKAILVILSLVTLQVLLDSADLLKRKLVEAKLKVNQVLVNRGSKHPFLSAFLVHLAVSHI